VLKLAASRRSGNAASPVGLVLSPFASFLGQRSTAVWATEAEFIGIEAPVPGGRDRPGESEAQRVAGACRPR